MCKQNVGSKGKAHDVQGERTGKRDSRRDLDLAFSRGAPCGARGCDTPRVALREACAREASCWLLVEVAVSCFCDKGMRNRVITYARRFTRGCRTRRSSTKDLGEVMCMGAVPRVRAQSLGFCYDGTDPSIGTVPSPRSGYTRGRTHEHVQAMKCLLRQGY